MVKKYFILFSISTFLILPTLIFAIDPVNQPTSRITDIWQLINSILAFIWPIFVGAVIIMIIFSGFMFVTSAGDPGKMKLARDALIYAIIGIVVAIFAYSAYQIINSAIGGTPATVVDPCGGTCSLGQTCDNSDPGNPTCI